MADQLTQAGVRDSVITDRYALYNADAMDVMAEMPDGSIHASIYSPPFAGLYVYSSSDRDVSNSRSYDEFRQHYALFVAEIHRLTKPGRLTAVHAAPIPSSNTGRDSYFDFPGDVIRLHEEHGWDWIARHVIWKEPLAVRNRTMAKNLAHKTITEDATLAGVATADELLIFRKRGENPEPVINPTGLDYYAGSENIPGELHRYRGFDGDQKANRYSHWIWRRYASSVWDDVRMDRVLPFREAKDDDDEKHVHPLQLDIIERFVQMRTMPGEVVLTPFMGVGSEIYGAVRMNRFGVGVELKPSYYVQATRNLAAAVNDDVEQGDDLLNLIEATT